MRKKIILRLLLFVAVGISLYSCVHDEIYSTSDPSSKEYQSKSLWKEDEIYITNVKEIYEENEDKIRKGHGTPLWDYAMTMDKFDESYLLVPIKQNGEVTEVLEVPRFGKKIYFKYTTAKDKLSFFRKFLIDTPKKSLPTSLSNDASKIICVTRTVSIWYPDNESDPNASGHWGSTSYTQCYDITIDTFENPDAGGDGGGYDYPPFGGGGGDIDSTLLPKSPCAILKDQITNVDYMDRITALDKPSVLNQKKEKGYSETKSGEFTELQQAASTEGSDGLTIPVSLNTKGYIHTHLNDYLTGTFNENDEPEIRQPIRMFSPADVNTLMTMAQFAADGDYSDLYGTMVSSTGNYTIKFTGTAADIKTGFDSDDWQTAYIAYREKNDKWSVERLFLNFLKYKMNVQGVDLYKIKDNGTVQRKVLNPANNKVDSNDCPQ